MVITGASLKPGDRMVYCGVPRTISRVDSAQTGSEQTLVRVWFEGWDQAGDPQIAVLGHWDVEVVR